MLLTIHVNNIYRNFTLTGRFIFSNNKKSTNAVFLFEMFKA